MPEDTENGVPVSHSASDAADRRRQQHAQHGDEREFEIAVEREQQQEDQEQRQRQDHAASARATRCIRCTRRPNPGGSPAAA